MVGLMIDGYPVDDRAVALAQRLARSTAKRQQTSDVDWKRFYRTAAIWFGLKQEDANAS